ncbi:sensor histidine kinase [Shewanella putrefaciens]|nr:sensor histidine kinase [Shewanella putrefaciens]
MVKNQQRLMGDISHELRTPLTRLQLSLALARKKGQQTTETDRIGYEANNLKTYRGIARALTSQTQHQRNQSALRPSRILSQVLDDAELRPINRIKKSLSI